MVLVSFLRRNNFFKKGKMKKYVVAVISFFENDIKQFKVEAENEYDAVKKGILSFTKEEYRKSELEFQDSAEYPTDVNGLNGGLDKSNSSSVCSFKNIGCGSCDGSERSRAICE